MTDQMETGFAQDRALGFTIFSRNSRGRVVRLGPLLDQILGAHDYPPVLAQCLGDALVLTALMGTMLKGEDDQLTMQAQGGKGLVNLMVCDYRGGELRGYLQPAEGASETDIQGADDLEALLGGSHLAITFDIASTGQRYQGIVPLEGGTLAEAVEGYFAQSEQIPTVARTAVRKTSDGWLAGGMMVQHLPEGDAGRERLHVRLDHPDWEHVAILSGSLRPEELVEPDLSLEDLIWRLFHEENEVRVQAAPSLTRGCRCSVIHFETVLARFSKEDRREMANEEGIILVDCAFCSREFAVQD